MYSSTHPLAQVLINLIPRTDRTGHNHRTPRLFLFLFLFVLLLRRRPDISRQREQEQEQEKVILICRDRVSVFEISSPYPPA